MQNIYSLNNNLTLLILLVSILIQRLPPLHRSQVRCAQRLKQTRIAQWDPSVVLRWLLTLLPVFLSIIGITTIERIFLPQYSLPVQLTFFLLSSLWLTIRSMFLQQKSVHKDEVAQAAAHHEDVEHLVRAEGLLMQGARLDSIDHTADRVRDAAREQPAEGSARQLRQDLGHRGDAQPAHRDIDDRGNPLGTGHPKGFNNQSNQCKTPDDCKNNFSKSAFS